jgi:hypothetical protein
VGDNYRAGLIQITFHLVLLKLVINYKRKFALYPGMSTNSLAPVIKPNSANCPREIFVLFVHPSKVFPSSLASDEVGYNLLCDFSNRSISVHMQNLLAPRAFKIFSKFFLMQIVEVHLIIEGDICPRSAGIVL